MATFQDMTIRERERWLAWAKSHEWGGDRAPRFVLRGGRVVMEATCGFFGSDEIEVAYHATPSELRVWAGY